MRKGKVKLRKAWHKLVCIFFYPQLFSGSAQSSRTEIAFWSDLLSAHLRPRELHDVCGKTAFSPGFNYDVDSAAETVEER